MAPLWGDQYLKNRQGRIQIVGLGDLLRCPCLGAEYTKHRRRSPRQRDAESVEVANGEKVSPTLLIRRSAGAS